jgi:WD40 repeat protein
LYMQLCAAASKVPVHEFLSQSKVDLYTAWEESGAPNANWARRYGGNYEQAIKYLADSRTFQKWERWKRRGLILAWPVLAIFIVGLFFWGPLEKSREQHLVLEFEGQARVVSNEGVSTTVRVPVAIALAQTAVTDGTSELKQELLRQVRLDQWEFFSAIRQGKSLDRGRPQAESADSPDSEKIQSSCGVAVDQSGRFIALADSNNLKIWEVTKAITATPADGKGGVSPSAVKFAGVDCVRFSPETKPPEPLRLLASSYSYKPSRADKRQSEVRTYSVDENGHLKDKPDSSTEIDAPVSVSFVENSGKVAVLTPQTLTVYPNSGKERTPLNGVVKAGFFSPTGRFLVISYNNGGAEIYDLHGPKFSSKKLDFVEADVQPTEVRGDTLQFAAFSTDSLRIATGSFNGWVGTQGNPFLAEPKAYTPIARMTGSISALALQGRGEQELVAAGTVLGDAAVFRKSNNPDDALARESWLLRISPGYTERGFAHYGAVTTVSFANGGDDLVTGSEDQKARVFEVSSGAETTRIPHESLVVSAVEIKKGSKKDDLVLSASQDANLQLTDLAKEVPTVTRKSQWDSCPVESSSGSGLGVWPSVVSPQGSWIWACGGKLDSLDATDSIDDSRTLQYGPSVGPSMQFSECGSAVAWLDKELRIHYARWNDKQKQWYTGAAKPWDDTPAEQPRPYFPPFPILTVSPNGDFVGISFTTKEHKSVIEVFRANEEAGGVSLEQLHTDVPQSDALASEARLHPYGVDADGHQVLTLAVSSQGSIAAGTVDGRVFRFTRQENKWIPSPIKLDQDKGSALVPQAQVISAVAFTRGSEDNLLVARNDSSIWLFSATGDPLYSSDVKPTAGEDAPARMFAFSKDGKLVAAVAGPYATFFAIEPHGLTKGLTLRERGVIQSIALADEGVFFTSVAIRDSLVKSKHNLNIEKHEQWICDKQPAYQDPTSPEEKGCKELRRRLRWTSDSSFWPGSSGNLCPDTGKN